MTAPAKPSEGRRAQATGRLPLRISADYIEWAHGPGAESGQPKARALCDLVGAEPNRVTVYVSDPELVREIASVAELYVGGPDNNLRAARVLSRARAWLRSHP